MDANPLPPPNARGSSTPAGANLDAELAAARDGAVVADASALGVLAATGADAGAFLHAQLSSDVNGLAQGACHWSSYNSPKGRLLATVFLYRPAAGPADRYVALLAADLVEAVRKRLAMFVLRSKVTLSDATPALARFGVGGPRADEAVRASFGTAPDPGRCATLGDVDVVHLPDGRFFVLAPAARARDAESTLERHAARATGLTWDWLGVNAGVPTITQATQDLFVPQTANWDAIGGLDFRKGCYPGQEIVARTQYLGRLKERLYVYRCERPAPAPATRLYAAAHGDQACGTVVNGAPEPSGRAVFLAVAQINGTESVAIGAPDGPTAKREDPPYPIPATVSPPGRVRL
jgi:folate-binding protein YgfZ